MKRLINYSLILLCSGMLWACSVNYSFTGTSIAPEIKTFSVEYFPNKSQLVNPNLSELFTEALKDKFLNQTKLELVREGGDLEFSGMITGYQVKPMAITAGEVAATNRLSVVVKVKFVNNMDHDLDFNKDFEAYSDFSSNSLLSDVEDELIELIIEDLTEDIFNKSAANW